MEAVSPPLSEPGPRRDPPSHAETGAGAPAPRLAGLSPSRGAGRPGHPPGPGDPQHPVQESLGARSSPEPPPAQGHRTGSARATSCHRPSSPHPCCRGVPAPAPRLFVCRRRRPRPAIAPSRAPRSPPGRPPRRGAGRAPRPDPPRGTHSGAAAAPASWGLWGPPAPRPARSRRLCRASARRAGSRPSHRAGERGDRGGRDPSAGAAPGCLAAGCQGLPAARAPAAAGAGLPGAASRLALAGEEAGPGPRAGPPPPPRAARAAFGAARSSAGPRGRGRAGASGPASGARRWGVKASGCEAEPLCPRCPV